MITDRLPILKAESPSQRDVALWRLNVKRWAATQHLLPYIVGPLPQNPDEDLVRDGVRYLLHSIENPHLAGDIADLGLLDSAVTAWNYIRANWLGNQSESDIVAQELNNLSFHSNGSILTFLSEFYLLLSNQTPF